jgi:hypothetical protein
MPFKDFAELDWYVVIEHYLQALTFIRRASANAMIS